MKKFLDKVIFILIIALIAIANGSFFGLSFSGQKEEAIGFDPKLNITQIFYSKDFSPQISGYGGHIPMAVGVDKHGVIKDIKILKNNETPNFLNRVLAVGILNRWLNKDISTAAAEKVDTVSGATISSVAIIKNMQAILNAQLNNSPAVEEPLNQLELFKSLAVLLVGLVGLFSFFVPKVGNKLRLYLTVLSIFVLGIWQGAMISAAKISAWIINGVPDMLQLPLFLIFLASILIPMFTGRNFYCFYLCPFGLAQDLVSKGIKTDIKITVFKWLQYARISMMLACFALLLFGFGLYIGNIEPFSAFKPEFAPVSAIVIFVIALLMATITPRFWCKYFCPCGAFLDLFKRKK